MRFLVVALALVFSLPATAQIDPARAFPLAVGNTWEYDDGTLRWEVVGEQTVEGERIAVLQFNDGPTCSVRTVPTSESFVAYRLADAADPGAPCGFSTDTVRYPGFNENPGGRDGVLYIQGDPQPATYMIGTATVAGGSWGSIVVPETGIRQVDTWTLLEGIGVVRFERYWTYGGGTQTVPVFDYELTYARIDGVEYGESAVAGESGPASVATSMTVGPNPAGTYAAVRYTLAEASTVRVEVFDALGRSVRTADVGAAASGPGTVPLNVAGLAPGVYAVRLTAGAAVASTRLVVAR